MLDRWGRSTQNMLAFAQTLRDGGAGEWGLRVLNMGGGDVDTHAPMGSMVFTVSPALTAATDVEPILFPGGIPAGAATG